jgi:hypothetical protein
MEKRYDIVDAFIYGMKNMMRTLRELTETKEEIRIVKKGNRITAAYYVDGKCVRHANSKCSKEDNFDFEFGSKFAFKRMWGDPNA